MCRRVPISENDVTTEWLRAAWQEHPRLAGLSWLPDVSIWNRENDWFRSRRALFLKRFGDRLQGPPPGCSINSKARRR